MIQRGDQVQVFGGRHDPDTGNERMLMVIWRGSKVVWSGPVDEQILADERLIKRDLYVRLPLKQHRAFRAGRRPKDL